MQSFKQVHVTLYHTNIVVHSFPITSSQRTSDKVHAELWSFLVKARTMKEQHVQNPASPGSYRAPCGPGYPRTGERAAHRPEPRESRETRRIHRDTQALSNVGKVQEVIPTFWSSGRETDRDLWTGGDWKTPE